MLTTLTARPERIVILTGAGISAESGLKTFRDNNGLWENHRVEEVATPEAFAANPELVYRFYNQRRAQLLSGEVLPNAAHRALAKLEAQFGGELTLITQNVDNLHECAGSQQVWHMHGELLSARCVHSGQAIEYTGTLDAGNRCQCCSPAQPMRPDIVWFGEMPLYMQSIQQALFEADLFVSVGTSGNVYPAAGFVELATQAGAYSLELNLQASATVSAFSESCQGLAGTLVPEFVERILSW